MAGKGLQQKLIRVFLLQIGLISIATLLGVFAAASIVENVLVRNALQGEAKHFWARYHVNSSFQVPDTLNLLAFLAPQGDYSSVPESLQHLEPGFLRAKFDGSEPIVYIEDKNNNRLYLVFDEQQVSELAFYFGVAPLSLVLIFIYIFIWFSYRQSRKAISPLVRLATLVDHFDFSKQRIAELDLTEFRQSSDSEVNILIDALDHFTARLEAFVERERNFTRDASHELRTPLAVIKSSLALLQKQNDLLPKNTQALIVIERTVHDMEELIETLLLLAREESVALSEDDIVLNDLLSNLIEDIQRSMDKDHIDLEISEHCLLTLRASEKVLCILFGNLLRNAFNYTASGQISMTIAESQVIITDSGIGIDNKQIEKVFEPFYRGHNQGRGHGLGLAIVKRICNRFNWSLKVSSKPGVGTSVTVIFPQAKRIGN